MQQGHVTLDAVEITVLDEADHMADLGFLPVVTRIMDETPAERPAPAVLAPRSTTAWTSSSSRFLHNEVLHSVDEATSHVAAMTHHVFEVDDVDAKNDLVADPRLGHRPPHPLHAHQAPRQEAREAAHRSGHPRRRPARQPRRSRSATATSPRSATARSRCSSRRMSRRAACTSTTSSSSSTSTRPRSTRRTCTARAAPPAPAARATSSPSCCPRRSRTSKTLLRKAAITVTPAARHRRRRRAVTALVGDVAAVREARPARRGAAGRRRPVAGRERPAQARRPRRPARRRRSGPRSRPWHRRRLGRRRARHPAQGPVGSSRRDQGARTEAGRGPQPRRPVHGRAARGIRSPGRGQAAAPHGQPRVAVAQQPSRAGLTPRTPEGPADRWSTGPSSCHRLPSAATGNRAEARSGRVPLDLASRSGWLSLWA